MNIKIKDIARKGISLVLALSMMVPAGVYAGTYTVNSWDEYREELKKAIRVQDDDINIIFERDMNFDSAEIINQAIANTYKKAVAEVPKQFGEFNIINNNEPVVIYNNDFNSIKGVYHKIYYYNDFKNINTALAALYETIKTERTDYDKIKMAYDYILGNLDHNDGASNHNILDNLGIITKNPVSAEAYAILFSIIMDKLGYENIIVIGTINVNPERHIWNLVKVQGNWYHVDSRLGDVNFEDKDKYFLATNDVIKNNYNRQWDIVEVERSIAEEEIEMAIGAVDRAETIIEIIPDKRSLVDIIIPAEAAVKTAEIEVKTIKDTVVKAIQQNRINQIKLVIAAIKAVYKAETATPLSMTYVTSAITALGKVSYNYQVTKDALNERLVMVENQIRTFDLVLRAVKAVEKVEKYMKVTDIVLARDAVESLKLLIINYKLLDTIYDLDNRIDVADKVVKAESSLIKYLKESSNDNGEALGKAIDDANSAISMLVEGTPVKIQRISRMTVIGSAKEAIEKVEEVKGVGTIEAAQEAISKVTDIKIQNELMNKLKGIVSIKISAENEKNAKQAVEDAEFSLKDVNTRSNQNIEAVSKAIVAVNKLPTGNLKTLFQTTIKVLNTAIKAKQIVENAEAKLSNSILTENDVILAEKAVLTVNPDYKPGLDDRVKSLRVQFETKKATDLLNKAEAAVKKAEETRVTTDITTAKKAVGMVSIKEDNKVDIDNLNARIKAMESYIATIKVLVNAEKYRNVENINAARTALYDFDQIVGYVSVDNRPIYYNMINNIYDRIMYIENYLWNESYKVIYAREAVEMAESAMTVDSDPTNESIQTAQNAVNMVTDKTLRAGLQKRIDAIQITKNAKLAVAKAVAYPNDKSVLDAETALSKVDGKYSDIIKFLSEEISKLRNQLDIAKKVAEASKLVQKAVDSRMASDISNARFAVDAIGELAPKSYNILDEILVELKASLDNASGIEMDALEAAKTAINGAIEIIGDTNTYIAQIIEGEDGEFGKIKTAYGKIESAKIKVIIANAAVRKLNDQKALLAEIAYANKEIELAEDNIDVKEAVRLVTIASSSVNNAKTEDAKSMAKLDIAAARRAIDKIGHNNNKAIKTTILNTINSIEKKLTTDNDQELINAAVVKVNQAADAVTKAVRDNTVIADQEVIGKTIFAAKLAIGWISDNNKAAKATLTGFLNDIEAMFIAEKDGIQNEERIKNAETAVIEAESKKGSDELESFIRSARLRIKIIKNDRPETEAKIDDLNGRLDILEGKGDGSSGNGGDTKPGGNNNGSSKPGGSTSIINIVPTTPLPDSKRVIGTTEPIWGKTKELKKANPTTGLSIQDMTVFQVNESKLKTIELSNVLKTTSSANAILVVRGKTIKLDSKPYINDIVNNSILLPVKFLGDELGFAVSLIDSPVANGSKRLLINGLVNGASKSIILDIGSEYGYVNGSLIKISSKPVIQEGRTYIPVDFMVEHLGITFSYYNTNGYSQLIVN